MIKGLNSELRSIITIGEKKDALRLKQEETNVRGTFPGYNQFQS